MTEPRHRGASPVVILPASLALALLGGTAAPTLRTALFGEDMPPRTLAALELSELRSDLRHLADRVTDLRTDVRGLTEQTLPRFWERVSTLDHRLDAIERRLANGKGGEGAAASPAPSAPAAPLDPPFAAAAPSRPPR